MMMMHSGVAAATMTGSADNQIATKNDVMGNGKKRTPRFNTGLVLVPVLSTFNLDSVT